VARFAVTANDLNDTKSREQIRMHLTHFTKMFSAGDFNVPMFIHRTPPRRGNNEQVAQ